MRELMYIDRDHKSLKILANERKVLKLLTYTKMQHKSINIDEKQWSGSR